MTTAIRMTRRTTLTSAKSPRPSPAGRHPAGCAREWSATAGRYAGDGVGDPVRDDVDDLVPDGLERLLTLRRQDVTPLTAGGQGNSHDDGDGQSEGEQHSDGDDQHVST